MAKAKLFNVNEMDWKQWGEGIRSCVLKLSPSATLQYWELQPGCGGATHNHEAVQLTYVEAGVMKLTVDGEDSILTQGCFAVIPSNAMHSTLNIGSATVVNIDIFLPDRDDREDSEKIRDFNSVLSQLGK